MTAIRMLLFLGTAFFTLVKVGTAPAKYDQSQYGESNLQAKLENLLFVIAYPSNINLNHDILSELASLESFKLAGKQQNLVFRSASSKEEESIKSDEETRGMEPYSVEIIQINENHSSKEGSIGQANGNNKEMSSVSNQQAIFSITNEKGKPKSTEERLAKNVKAFDFPKSREEPAIIGYFVDAKKMLGSKLEDDGRGRNVVENVENTDIESGKPGTTLKKQLLQREEDIALSSSNADKNDVALSEDKQKDELVLLGYGIENCGPERHRDKSGICQFDKSTSAPL